MFDRLIAFSLRNRLLVVALAAALLVYGSLALRELGADVFPDLNRPTVTVMTEAEGLAPEEVETLVTVPLERALYGAPGVRRVRSTSGIALSMVQVEFDWGSDVYRDRQVVSERLQTVSAALPAGVTPQLGPVTSIMGEVVLLAVEPDPSMPAAARPTPMQLRTFADWTLRPRLLSLPGVAQVVPIGGEVRQLHVLADPSRLRAAGLGLDDVARAVSEATGAGTGGYLDRRGTELLVRSLGRARGPEDLASAVVALRDGVPVLLAQVAEVREAPRPRRGDAGANGLPAVVLSVQKQPGADTLALTRAIEAAALEAQRAAPPGVRINPRLFRQADFIEAAVGNVLVALRDGAVLVTVVLLLFLLNARTTLITLTAIPLSFVTAALTFRLFGFNVNTMTLGGLAVAVGELVDDAIVDVENVFRRLRENARSADPQPPLEVVRAASAEVRNSIVYATVLVVLVFLPLFALGGVEGRLFVPLGAAYIVSIVASLLVSLTVTPALCGLLLTSARALGDAHRKSALVRGLERLDRALLARTLTRPRVVVAAAAALVLAAALYVPRLGVAFLPAFNEGTLTVNLLARPGTSLDESSRLGALAERLLRAVPEVQHTGRRTGRAELDEHAEGVHYTELDVALRGSPRPRAAVLADVRARLAAVPGVSVSVGAPIAHRLDHLLSGVRAQVAIKVFGDELDGLRAAAARVRDAARAVPGVTDLQLEAQVLVPQVSVRVDRARASRLGLNAGAVARAVQTALRGDAVAQLLEGGGGARTVDVVVRYASGLAREGDLDALRALPMALPNGGSVPLAEVADVREALGPNQIVREAGRRRVVVSCNVSGRELGAVVRELRAAVDRVPLPPGAYVVFDGQHESQRQATRQIALLAALSLLAMVAVLYAHFRAGFVVLQVLLNVPLALVGSVAALALAGEPLSVASLVGFVTLCGIAARNGIMMVSHYLHLMQVEGEPFSREMVVRGSLERLVPVLMTALTAALGLLPLVLEGAAPGREILRPVAVVILGGLASSTLLDVLVTPAVFYAFGRPSAERLAAAYRALQTQSPATRGSAPT